MRLMFTVILCAISLSPAALAQQKPEDFAVTLPIVTETTAPYYRLTIPIEAYLQSARGDLYDLRIFNSGGQIVPHARLAASGRTEESRRRTPLRWFPILTPTEETPPKDDKLDVVVRQNGDGTLVEVKRQSASPASSGVKSSAVRGYILDASQIAERASIRHLELDWPKGAGDFHLIDIESSDDLRHWDALRRNVQVARLEYNGAHIENRRIDLSGFQERYLRLIWREPAKAPPLTNAEIEQTASRYENAPLAWSAPMTLTRVAGQSSSEYNLRLPRSLPVSKLRIELPSGNVLLPLSVLHAGEESRQHRHLNVNDLRHLGRPHSGPAKQALQRIASTVAYRIVDKKLEWTHNEISLDGSPRQTLILQLDPRSSPAPETLAVSFAVAPDQLIFLAGGNPPYTLKIGNTKADDSALAPGTLVPGFGSKDGLQIADARVQIEALPPATSKPGETSKVAMPSLPPEETNWKKYALWSVLLAGVLGMVLMATQLLRQIKKAE